MAARAEGARRNAVRDVRLTVRQGLWTAVLISLPGCLALWHGEQILLLLRQPPELAALAGEYLRALLWAMPPFLGFLVLRSFLAALQKPRWAFIVAVAGIAFNVLGNWVLVFGNLGAPALGLVGAGVASALASLCLFLGLALVVLRDRRFRRYRLFGNLLQPDWQRLAAFWKLGLPIGVATAFEVTIFNAAAFLIGWLGEAELAAHAIAIQIASVTFMIPYGVAQAATVRVSHAQGAGDASGVARAGWSAFGLGIGSMAIAALLMVTVPYLLVSAFMDVRDPANARVLGFAVGYLAVAAIFQIVDGAQVLARACCAACTTRACPWSTPRSATGAWAAQRRLAGLRGRLARRGHLERAGDRPDRGGGADGAALDAARAPGAGGARPDVHASAHARARAAADLRAIIGRASSGSLMPVTPPPPFRR